MITENRVKEARETLNFLEQLRHATATLVGAQDIETTWPVRVLVHDGKRQPHVTKLAVARDAYVASVVGPSQEFAASAAQVFLDSWPGQLPAHLSRGLVTLLSTLEVDATRVTLGTPPASKDRDWSRAHMLTVDPEYSGRVRVLLANLGRGMDMDVAYRNAFGKTATEIERAVDAYIEKGNFATAPVSGKAISAQRQFYVREIAADVAQILNADVLLATDAPGAEAAYAAILKSNPNQKEAHEAMALLAVRAGKPDQAKTHIEQGKGARALVELASITKDPAAKRQLLWEATTLNAKWARAHRELAAAETHLAQKLIALRAAAKLEPRNPANWIGLAKAQEENNQFAEAGKSWTSAELATADSNERQLVSQARAQSESKRVEQGIAEREEVRRKADQELNDLRNRALADIRKAEALANEGKPVIDGKTLPDFGELQRDTIKARLQHVECLEKVRILHLVSGKEKVKVSVRDIKKIVKVGTGEIACGPVKPVRTVTVSYLPASLSATINANGESNTPDIKGEAARIEFH